MNQKYLLFNVLLAMSLFLSACSPPATTSQELPSQTQPGPPKAPQPTISEWTATPPPTVTPPYTAEVQAEAAQAFSNGAMVFFYDPQPATVSLSDLEKTTFSVRYILSNDAIEVTNILLLWKANAGGDREFIIPETSDVLAQTVNLRDWFSPMGMITFSTTSKMADTSDQQDVDPNIGIFTTWFITWDGVTPLYAHPNQNVEDPVYLDIYLIAPEEDAGSLLLSDQSKQLSNSVRIPVTP